MLTVRPATRDDADAIARINADDLGYDHPVDKVRSQLDQLNADDTQLVIVADQDGEVIGIAHARDYLQLYLDPLVDVMGIAVASSHRRTGAGRALMLAIEDWALGRRATGIRLVSGTGRPEAHLFYESLGYVALKTQVNLRKPLPS